MKNILNLFRPSQREKQLEEELNGKPSTRQPSVTSTPPPKRRGTATPASHARTHTGADVSELSELRISLQNIESKLQETIHERDSIRAEFSQYREAANSDQRDLEQENSTLKQRFHEVSLELSKQIAAGGLNGPISEGGSAEVVRSGGEVRGLARSIAAAKAEAASTKFERIPRPTL